MRSVYVSATYKDLREFRRAVHDALRSIRYDVIRMEDYVARDQHTRAACEADVERCDVYIGIFAWRYGYIPEQDNPERKSITELEYRKARSEKKTCLLFLLAEDVPWSPGLMDLAADPDDHGARIRAFRDELKMRAAGYFRSPEDLAKQVLAAIYQDEATKRVQTVGVLDEIKQGVALGPSYLLNIQQKISDPRSDAEVVELSLGPIPWWTTRLHLVAALAEDFTRIRQFVFRDEQGRFVLMCSPTDLRSALRTYVPPLEIAYLQSRNRAPEGNLDAIVNNYQPEIFQAFGSRVEEAVKEDVDPMMLKRLVGRDRSDDVVVLTGQPRAVLQYEIAKARSDFVALVQGDNLEGVVDRVELLRRVATQVLQAGL